MLSKYLSEKNGTRLSSIAMVLIGLAMTLRGALVMYTGEVSVSSKGGHLYDLTGAGATEFGVVEVAFGALFCLYAIPRFRRGVHWAMIVLGFACLAFSQCHKNAAP